MSTLGGMTPFITSIVRTIVPVIVGLILSGLAKVGLEDAFDAEEITGAVSIAVTTIVTAAYYAGVRWLEQARSSKWGWLLGSPNAPTYPTK